MKTLRNMQTKDRIAQAIREEILSGHMEPGEELAQEALAEMLGVSRMPVREALQTLVQDGFARRLPNRHIQAVVLDSSQIHDVFRTAGVMEAELVSLALENRRKAGKNTDLDFSGTGGALRKILQFLEKASDLDQKIQYEMEFHECLISLADNPYLEQLQNKVMDGYVSYAISNLPEKEQVLNMLQKAAEAVEKGDAGAAGAVLKEYYMYYADRFAERWRQS